MQSSDDGGDSILDDLNEHTSTIRGVAVIWHDGELPDVEFLGECNPYEAMGLLRLAYKRLEDEYALPFSEEEDPDDA